MRYRKTSIYLQYTVLPVHIDIDLYSTIGHVYGDYELTCGVTSMRPSGSEFRWIFVKTTDAGSYMLEAFTLANNIGHMSLGGACHSVQPLDVRVGGPH